MSDATGLTASLTGIGGRHLLQGPLPPVTDQLVTALTSAGSAVVGAGTGLLGTLEVLPSPPARHLLQESPPPLTGDAVLLNAVGAVLPACALFTSQSHNRTLLQASCGLTWPLPVPVETGSHHSCGSCTAR